MSLRERKKASTRAEILGAARRLFATSGFDATTVEEVCRDAVVSRRTFFRYFDSKEALVFPNREERLARFRTYLAARPTNETVFERLNQAAAAFATEYTEHREQLLSSQALINSSSRLLARERAIDREWERVIEEAFASESPNSEVGRRQARVLAGATIGVIRATMRYWFSAAGAHEDLSALGAAALASLQNGFDIERE